MLDIKFIRENPDVIKEALKNRNAEANVAGLLPGHSPVTGGRTGRTDSVPWR